MGSDSSDESVPVYIFRLGETMDAGELERLGRMVQDTADRAGLNAEFLFLNPSVTPIDKSELLSELSSETDTDAEE